MSQIGGLEPKQEIIIPNSSGHQMPSSGHSSRSKPQACKICGKMLSSASSYYVHMKLHSGTKPFACTVRHNHSIIKFELNLIFKLNWINFFSQVCEAAFCRKPYLEVHMRTHTGERPFQCDLCLKRFSQKSSLNTHKRIHTGKFISISYLPFVIVTKVQVPYKL